MKRLVWPIYRGGGAQGTMVVTYPRAERSHLMNQIFDRASGAQVALHTIPLWNHDVPQDAAEAPWIDVIEAAATWRPLATFKLPSGGI